MASDYCYSKEMKRAMERHERGEARVIPIILRHIYWKEAPFGKLQVLPTDANPVMSPRWHNQDEAFLDVTEGIRKAVEKLTNRPNQLTLPTAGGTLSDQASPPPSQPSQPLIQAITPPSQRLTVPAPLPAPPITGTLGARFIAPAGQGGATPHKAERKFITESFPSQNIDKNLTYLAAKAR